MLLTDHIIPGGVFTGIICGNDATVKDLITHLRCITGKSNGKLSIPGGKGIIAKLGKGRRKGDLLQTVKVG